MVSLGDTNITRGSNLKALVFSLLISSVFSTNAEVSQKITIKVNDELSLEETDAGFDVLIKGNKFENCKGNFNKYCDGVGMVLTVDCESRDEVSFGEKVLYTKVKSTSLELPFDQFGEVAEVDSFYMQFCTLGKYTPTPMGYWGYPCPFPYGKKESDILGVDNMNPPYLSQEDMDTKTSENSLCRMRAF